jgi:hypothetical protein
MKQHLSRILGALVTLLRVFFSWDECEHLHPVAKCVVSSKSKFYRIGKEQFSGWRCARWFGYARERTSIAQHFASLTHIYRTRTGTEVLVIFYGRDTVSVGLRDVKPFPCIPTVQKSRCHDTNSTKRNPQRLRSLGSSVDNPLANSDKFRIAQLN